VRFVFLLLAIVMVGTGCPSAVAERFALGPLVDAATDVGDVRKVCTLGAALIHPLAATGPDAWGARVIAEGIGASCDEKDAWEADLAAQRARHLWPPGDAQSIAIEDASLVARRAHGHAADRFERSFEALQKRWPASVVADGISCPNDLVSAGSDEQFAWVFGLVTGTLALLHDASAGGVVGVPRNRLAVLARASLCVDDNSWWFTPKAVRGAAAAIVGDAEGWSMLASAADAGDRSGVRVARAFQVLMAMNAGRTDIVSDALARHAASLVAHPRNEDWALLDEYAFEVSQQQSDLWWTEVTGHRTPTFGMAPPSPSSSSAPSPPTPVVTDPFAE
jgi:hypothetical protein